MKKEKMGCYNTFDMTPEAETIRGGATAEAEEEARMLKERAQIFEDLGRVMRKWERQVLEVFWARRAGVELGSVGRRVAQLFPPAAVARAEEVVHLKERTVTQGVLFEKIGRDGGCLHFVVKASDPRREKDKDYFALGLGEGGKVADFPVTDSDDVQLTDSKTQSYWYKVKWLGADGNPETAEYRVYNPDMHDQIVIEESKIMLRVLGDPQPYENFFVPRKAFENPASLFEGIDLGQEPALRDMLGQAVERTYRLSERIGLDAGAQAERTNYKPRFFPPFGPRR
jgi:hypothetical protein